MTQPDLFTDTLRARFEKFDRTNPIVRELFVRFAEEAKRAGRRRIGAKAIAERIRWFTSVETTGDHFKINNSYVSLYAREIARLRPDLAGLFEMRSIG